MIETVVPSIPTKTGPVFSERCTRDGRRVLFALTWLLVLAVLAPANLTAQTPYLVKDINPATDMSGSNPRWFTQVGAQTFFSASTPDGAQLWKTDGALSGTVAVTDTYFTSISSMSTANGKAYFVANTASGYGLWVSDGTAAGTILLTVAEPSGTSCMGSSSGSVCVATSSTPVDVNGVAYFIAGNGSGFGSHDALWKTDGTSAGTSLVKDFSLGDIYTGTLSSPTAMNGTLYFVATAFGLNAVTAQLWKSDGTAAGTAPVATIPVSGSTAPSNLINVNGVLFFTSGTSLWKSDGTPTGTVMVQTITSSSTSTSSDTTVQEMTNVNGALYFRVYWGSSIELWKSDGTSGGTSFVASLCSDACTSTPSYLTNVNGTLYYSAQSALWTTDGTSAGTIRIADNLLPANLVNVNGALFFFAGDYATGRELWKSDGTAVGTVIVKDICPGACSSTLLLITPAGLRSSLLVSTPSVGASGGKLFFAATEGQHGAEPWVSDGTAAGTFMLKNITLNTSAMISWATDLSGTLLFAASDGTSRQLWKTAGTEATTSAVHNVNASIAFPALPNNTLLFLGADNSNGEYGLWATDGTDAGTSLLRDFTGPGTSIQGTVAMRSTLGAVRIGNNVFFAATDSQNGPALWRSNGTAAGTVMVKNLTVATGSSTLIIPVSLTAVGSTLFFTDDNGAGGVALWKSDGTSDGTVAIKDFPACTPEPCVSPVPQSLVNFNGALVFVANSPSGQLWKSDGTAAGTVVIDPSTDGWSMPNNLVPVNATLFYVKGWQLWKTDGTVGGAVLVKDLSAYQPPPTRFAPIALSAPNLLTNVNGALFFTMGSQLWKSDGTADGTVKVKDISASMLTNVKGSLYFVGRDANGAELWKSDGTADGTTMIADLNPGPAGSWPMPLATSHGLLYFTAKDGIHGSELWALTIAPTSVNLAGPANPIVAGKPITLIASVTSIIGGTTPTGAVTFFDGSSPVGTAAVDGSGTAKLTLSTLAAGTHTITAVYGGDDNYAASAPSPVLSQIVLAIAPDYTLAATPASAAIRAGDSATFTITASWDTYFNGTVTFSCGTLPAGVSCAFSPASLTPIPGQPSSQTRLVVSTASHSAVMTRPAGPPRSIAPVLWASLSGFGLLGCVLLGAGRRSRTKPAIAALLVIVILLGFGACGGSKTNNPQPSTISVQVNATATAGTTGGNTAAHQLVVNIVVQ